jgi:hypothetical protein
MYVLCNSCGKEFNAWLTEYDFLAALKEFYCSVWTIAAKIPLIRNTAAGEVTRVQKILINSESNPTIASLSVLTKPEYNIST